VKVGGGACPFCGAEQKAVDEVPRPTGRLSRSALFAASAVGAALATTDCSSSPVPLPLYGAAPIVPVETKDAGADAPTSLDGATDGHMIPPDAPSVVALYGGFAPVDAEAESNSGTHPIPLYGAAPIGS
jgi:hypothetical protein